MQYPALRSLFLILCAVPVIVGGHSHVVEALCARFRIAIGWPHLPMITSDTGANFFSIMCAPGVIEKTLTWVTSSTNAEPVSERQTIF